MIAEAVRLWTKAEVWELRAYMFPGGYSCLETAGDCEFDVEAAWQAVNFGPRFIRHVRGELGGESFVPEVWEAAIFANIFGWKMLDKRRRYRIVYVEVPRGNGKSFLCVVIVGILLYIDDEPGADIFSAAGTRDQAREVFGPFKHNVLSNPDLASISRPYQNSVTRVDPETGLPVGVYKAISADADFQHGGSPHGIIFDELHVQPNRELWDVLHTGKIKRRNPLTVAITTAGFDRESICYEQRRWAEQVRDGSVEDRTFFPVIYAAEDGDDWTSPEVWRKANPNMGVSIKEEDIAIECEKAKQQPGYENTFKRLHLNIWTATDERWLAMDRWKICGKREIPELAGSDCYVGIDLSSTTDVTAMSLVFDAGDGGVYVLPYFWIPEQKAMKRSNRDRFDYLAHKEFVTIIPGDWVEYGPLRATLNELQAKYNIRKIAIDRWNATQVTQELMGDGFDMELFGQGFASMSAPSKEFERLVLAGKLYHGNNPVLRWMAANVAKEEDAAGNIKPSKKKSKERIDGIPATVMGVAMWMQYGKNRRSVYETRGITTISEPEPEKKPVLADWWGKDSDDDDTF
jgi:phage terminase large subunit-like protein